ncbi:MAG: PA2779 family protein [Deltaproteobacteria bacterium]|nr:PA2779 family protein [Deltaproteobacteria bacterium]MBW2338774.1 PA2779 family protein [Deltaproteobacteria bacterium]
MRKFKDSVLTRRIAMLLVILMGIFSVVPRIEASFVPSDESFASSARHKDMASVQKVLEQKLIKERLKDLGYTDQEINSRLDQLSDSELHQFATQLDSLTSGGSSLVWILVIVLAVIAVLYFTNKRIVIQ